MLIRRRDMPQRPQQFAQPFRELQDLQEQTAQLLQQILPAVPGPIQPWIPDVDVEETEDAWIVEAELPGARPEDVHVEVHNGELTIRGEITERERSGVLRRRTRRAGEFEYRVSLPEPIDSENPQARLRNGVLEVRIPKSQRSRAREIRVQSDAPEGGGAPESETVIEQVGAAGARAGAPGQAAPAPGEPAQTSQPGGPTGS
jgi:HSP20 family protein